MGLPVVGVLSYLLRNLNIIAGVNILKYNI
jgi:hypothetical protein